MSKLDRSKPYGEVFGGVGEVKYEQNGKSYNAQGIEVAVKGAAPASAVTTDSGMTLKHRGRGRYDVTDAEGNLVADNVSKAEAEAIANAPPATDPDGGNDDQLSNQLNA